MDARAHRVANLLVGNPEGEGALEITLVGPSLVFRETALIAICGADLSPRVGERAIPMHCPVLLRAGSTLAFGLRQSGCRSYLAVHGGFDVSPVMNSKSTYLRAGFGGFQGRALRKGDELGIAADGGECCYPELEEMLRNGDEAFCALDDLAFAPSGGSGAAATSIRVVAGQQWDALSNAAQAQFTSALFRISTDSDRMGYRLEGPKLELREPLEMISEGVTFGTVQLPPDGKAIVLMADRQTTGGYPKIANVATTDLPSLAQMMPHQELRFAMISLDEAQERYLADERRIGAIAQAVQRRRRAS
jgi:biotin-dependent carboxylase-like uncharacterized protein